MLVKLLTFLSDDQSGERRLSIGLSKFWRFNIGCQGRYVPGEGKTILDLVQLPVHCCCCCCW